ncbi:DUF1501 domain-containing protein [bacterium]|nr:DUF1501 domain-containing protein [bacterium]
MNHDTCKCTRRDLLRWGAQAGAALTFGQVLGLTSLFAQPAKHPKACILLWMAGGPSQLDTFDPKPGSSNGGEFRAIPTAVPGIQISEHLPLLAREMKDLAIIRSMNSREGSHERARYFVHTGYVQSGVTQHPSFGSIVAKELMDKSKQLPAYITINGPGISSGLLGVDFAPFVVRDALRPLDNLKYADSVTSKRFRDRLSLVNSLDREFSAERGQKEFAEKATIYERAVDLMHSPDLSAFDVQNEKNSTRQRYGSGKFATGCLIARRLIEKGVRFVEVEFDGWDTHVENFTRTKELSQQLDPAFASLIQDLRATGLLDSTLVVWMGEFGRTPEINGKGGRNHWPQAWSAVLAGAGIKGGQVIGATDKDGMEVKENPVSVPDLYATLCKCMGIDDSQYNSSPLGRPLRITDHGKAVTALL